MSLLSRGARAAARPSRQLILRQPRRFDSHHASSGESAFSVAGGTGNESFGKGFYIAIVIIPLSFLTYSVATSSDSSPLSKLIHAYRAREAELVRQNTVNLTVMKQASLDRHLFLTKEQDIIGPEIRHPEQFNSGSPWNVSAGHGGADLNHLIEHYMAENKIAEEARQGKAKDGKVSTVYDDTAGAAFPSFGRKK